MAARRGQGDISPQRSAGREGVGVLLQAAKLQPGGRRERVFPPLQGHGRPARLQGVDANVLSKQTGLAAGCGVLPLFLFGRTTPGEDAARGWPGGGGGAFRPGWLQVVGDVLVLLLSAV